MNSVCHHAGYAHVLSVPSFWLPPLYSLCQVDGRNIALKEMNPAWVNGMMAHEVCVNLHHGMCARGMSEARVRVRLLCHHGP